MEGSTSASDAESKGSGQLYDKPTARPANDLPSPSHNGETLMVSDAESDYSGISNEDFEDVDDSEDDEAMVWSPKEEDEGEVLLIPKEEEFSDEESTVAEEIPVHEVLPVKEEVFSEESDVEFAGFDEPIAIRGPIKRKRGLSPDINSTVDEEDEDDGCGCDDQQTPVKMEECYAESGLSGTHLPPQASSTVSQLRLIPIRPWVHVPKGNNRPTTKIFNCYYCPVSFKMKAYLSGHILRHLKNGDPKYEVTGGTGEKVHPAYIRGTVWPRPQNKRNTQWNSKPWRGKALKEYYCYYCPTSFRLKAYLPAHVLDHLKKGSPKFEVTDSTGRKVHPSYLLETGKNDLWPKEKVSDDRPFKCHLCSFSTKHLNVLRSHLKLKAKQALEPKVFSCHHCDWTTNKKCHLWKHMKGHIPGPHKCDFCDHRAHRRSELEMHTRNLHTGEKPFACDMCDARFTGKCHLQRHMVSHKTRNHRCPHCEFSSTSGTALSEHILGVHLGLRNYGCPLCKFEAGDTIVLRSHVRFVHRMKLEKVKCRYCDFEAVKPATLNVHERTHVYPGGGYPCDQCAVICRDLWLLKKHTLCHTGEKPFACDLCDYRCVERKGLRRHMVTHTDVKTEKCSHCDKTFKTKQAVIYHERYVHNLVEKKFCCRFCDYKAYIRKSLKQHELIHTGERNFPCPKCDYAARLKSTLTNHIRRSHPQAVPADLDGPQHKCDLCDFRALKSAGLTAHMSVTHPTVTPYRCEYCDAPFRLKVELIDHERIHTGEKKRPRRKGLVYKRWSCRFCDFVTIPFKKLKLHYEEFHPDEIKEEMVPELQEREEEDAGGKTKHKTMSRRKCRFCSYESSHRRTVRMHEQKHVYEMMGKISDAVMRM